MTDPIIDIMNFFVNLWSLDIFKLCFFVFMLSFVFYIIRIIIRR